MGRTTENIFKRATEAFLRQCEIIISTFMTFSLSPSAISSYVDKNAVHVDCGVDQTYLQDVTSVVSTQYTQAIGISIQ